MEKMKAIVVMIVLWILAYTVTFTTSDVDKQYQEEGIPVSATITSVEYRLRGKRSYQCTYINENGQKVQAYLILNKFSGDVGDVVQGMYLPDEPNEVYCQPSKLLIYGLMIVIDGLALFVTVIVLLALFDKPKNDVEDDIFTDVKMNEEKEKNEYQQDSYWTVDTTLKESKTGLKLKDE